MSPKRKYALVTKCRDAKPRVAALFLFTGRGDGSLTDDGVEIVRVVRAARNLDDLI